MLEGGECGCHDRNVSCCFVRGKFCPGTIHCKTPYPVHTLTASYNLIKIQVNIYYILDMLYFFKKSPKLSFKMSGNIIA